MRLFHALAALYALFMLARHLPAARQRRPASIVTCLVSALVLLVAARALLVSPA